MGQRGTRARRLFHSSHGSGLIRSFTGSHRIIRSRTEAGAGRQHWLRAPLSGTLALVTTLGFIGAAGVASVAIATPASSATLTLPLAPPLAFEDSDGNMTCEGTGGTSCTGATPQYLDWASPYVSSPSGAGFANFLNEPDGDTGCTGGTDLIFASGSKESSTSVTVACSSSPPKVDLTQAYAWHQNTGGDEYLYLAWEAPNQSGGNNNHVDFELNQKSQNYPFSPSNLISTSNNSWTLNRTNGDLLFDYNSTTTVPTICYSVWDSGAWVFPTGGTSSTDCASNEALLNGAQAGTAGGSGFTDPLNSAVIPAGGFGEMGIDLTTAGLFKAGSCSNFANVTVKGRSSGSGQDSELKSFIAPASLSLSNCTLTTNTPSSTTLGAAGTTDTASLTGATVSNLDTVTYNVYKGSDSTACAGTAVFTSTKTVTSAPTIPASAPFVPSTAGSYEWQAVYNQISGGSVTSACGSEPLTVNPAASTISTTSSPTGSVVLGATTTATDTATVTGVKGGPTPAGTGVSFYSCYNATTSPTTCDSSGTPVGTNPYAFTSSATDGSGNPTASVTSSSITLSKAGYYCFFASYSGDSNYNASSDTDIASECFQVTKATTGTSTVSSPDTSTTNAQVVLGSTGTATDTATITGNSTGGAPTGTTSSVSFVSCYNLTSSPTNCGSGGNPGTSVGTASFTAGTPSADQSQAVSDTIDINKVGYYCFFATYAGDSNYQSSSDTDTTTECFQVTKYTPGTVTTPSITGSVVLGANSTATDLATVTGATGAPVPTGTVTFTYCYSLTAITSCSGGTSAGSGSLSGTTPDTASSSSISIEKAGYYCFDGVYGGDNNYTTSSDGSSDECFQVTQAPTATTTTTSGSVDLLTSDTATDTAKITSSAGVAMTGTIQFYACKVSSTPGVTGTCDDITANEVGSAQTVSGTPPVSVLSPTYTVSAVGSYCFSAVYSGDDNYVGSSDNTGSNNVDTAECFSVTQPVLNVVKGSTPAPGSVVPLGTTVTYSLVLTNTGTAVALDVTATDAVPTGTTYVAGSASCGGAPGCTASESGGTVTWSGLNVATGSANALTVTFQVTVDSTDTNGEVLSNVAAFTNAGTPGCTTVTCPTNTVTLTVIVPATAPAQSPPIVAATTVHTGEPWAGSRLIELIVLGLGLSLVAIGELGRRRMRRRIFIRR